MKKIIYITLLLVFTSAHSQNDIKARLEFEEAETAFQAEDYEKALKHLTTTEKLIGKWTPVVSYVKIETLYALTNLGGNFGNPTIQPLYEEVTKYMRHLNKLPSEDVPIEKYKLVYSIEKTFMALNFFERQTSDFIKAKKEHDNKNYSSALTLYQKLAQEGNSWAMRNIAVLYHYGLGVNEDVEEAKKWYIKAVNKGNSEAACELGDIALSEKKVQDYKKWLLKAADLGHPWGNYMTATSFDTENPAKAFDYYRKAAQAGNAAGLSKVGTFYKDGKIVELNYTKAAQYFKKAAIKGNSRAKYNLGILYFDGDGVEKDTKKGMDYFLDAAEGNNTDAMGIIAWIYEEGKGGFPVDYLKAESWYNKAIQEKDNYYYQKLARLYSLSNNYNPKKALENYEKAAEFLYSDAIIQTANFYYSGKDGIAKDYTKAVKFYEMYYERLQKNEAYIDNLIDMYNRGGNGLEKNKEKVKYWREIRRK